MLHRFVTTWLPTGTRWCDWGDPQPLVGCSRFYMGDFMNSSAAARQLIDFGYSAGDEETPISPYVNGDEFARCVIHVRLQQYVVCGTVAAVRQDAELC